VTESPRTLVSACFALACLLLAGCDAQFPLTSESKINAAVPIPVELESARKAVSSELTQKRFYEEEWRRRMALRALSCSRGFTPSWYTSLSAVREKLTDLACFQKHDAETAKWIGYLRLGAVAAKPALRPIPASVPKTIAADAQIREVVFADAAGVAVLSTDQDALLVDLANGEIIRRSTISNGEKLGTLSPNGRLIGFESSNRKRMSFYSTETGEEIGRIDMASTYSTHWLGNECILYGNNNAKTVAIDLAVGKEVETLPFPFVTQVLPLPEEPNRFIIRTHRTVIKATTLRKDGDLAIDVLDERAVEMGGQWSKYTTRQTSDGAFISVPPPRNDSTLLSILDVQTLETENVDLGPGVRTTLVLGADEPGKFLLRIATRLAAGVRFDPKRESRDYIYSIADKTLTPISPRIPDSAVMARSLRTVFGVSDGRLVQYRPAPTDDPPMSLEEFAAQNRARDAQNKLASMERTAIPGAQYRLAPGGQSVLPPLADLAANARIEAVGVYKGGGQWSLPATGGREPTRPSAPRAVGAGYSGGVQPPLPSSARPITPQAIARERRRQKPVPTVEVRIRRSDKPIVLVLSSYEAVLWKLTRESGANIALILLGGYEESSVTGEGNSRVITIGRKYAYSMSGSDYSQLNTEVFNWTGRRIDILQGRYEGSSFIVGGR
jgi:hypothetical protein